MSKGEKTSCSELGGWIALSVPICLRPFTYICVEVLVTLIFAVLNGCDLINAVKMEINGRYAQG
jgi:hypothetical protein